MWLWRHRKLAVGVAAVTLLSGGAGAFAAAELSSNPREAYINDVASRLNVTPTALKSAMKQAMIDQINAAQKAGKLTAAQSKAAKSWIKNGHAAGGFGGPGRPRPGFAPGAWPSGPGRFNCGGSSTTTSTTTMPCEAGPPGAFGPHFGRVPGCGGGPTTKTSTTAMPCNAGPPGRFGPPGHWFPCRGQSAKPTTSTTTTSTTTTSTTTTSTAAKPCPGGPGFGPHAGFRGPHAGFRGPHAGFGFGIGFVPGLGESAVTSYLGISAATLHSDLAAGKSLAQIAAGISGKSVSGLESALTAAAKTRLDKAFSAGWMTAAQEAKALSALQSLLSTFVNYSF